MQTRKHWILKRKNIVNAIYKKAIYATWDIQWIDFKEITGKHIFVAIKHVYVFLKPAHPLAGGITRRLKDLRRNEKSRDFEPRIFSGWWFQPLWQILLLFIAVCFIHWRPQTSKMGESTGQAARAFLICTHLQRTKLLDNILQRACNDLIPRKSNHVTKDQRWIKSPSTSKGSEISAQIKGSHTAANDKKGKSTRRKHLRSLDIQSSQRHGRKHHPRNIHANLRQSHLWQGSTILTLQKSILNSQPGRIQNWIWAWSSDGLTMMKGGRSWFARHFNSRQALEACMACTTSPSCSAATRVWERCLTSVPDTPTNSSCKATKSTWPKAARRGRRHQALKHRSKPARNSEAHKSTSAWLTGNGAPCLLKATAIAPQCLETEDPSPREVHSAVEPPRREPRTSDAMSCKVHELDPRRMWTTWDRHHQPARPKGTSADPEQQQRWSWKWVPADLSIQSKSLGCQPPPPAQKPKEGIPLITQWHPQQFGTKTAVHHPPRPDPERSKCGQPFVTFEILHPKLLQLSKADHWSVVPYWSNWLGRQSEDLGANPESRELGHHPLSCQIHWQTIDCDNMIKIQGTKIPLGLQQLSPRHTNTTLHTRDCLTDGWPNHTDGNSWLLIFNGIFHRCGRNWLGPLDSTCLFDFMGVCLQNIKWTQFAR